MNPARTAALGRAPARLNRERAGLLLGLVGVIAFSLTLPMTRLAVAELDPWFVAFGRMALAGVVAGIWLLATHSARPHRKHLPALLSTALGIVIGFPLFTSLAMQTVPANHGAVVTGALPFATALAAALLTGEHQPRRFWICAAVGLALVVAFALRDGDGAMQRGDLWLLIAVVLCALGYVFGGRLSAQLGGAATILWALVIALPLTAPVAAWFALTTPLGAGAAAWSGLAYVTLISQLFGFFAWYNGLALGGVARVGQLQLLQIFFTIGFAGLFFGERIAADTWLFAAAVIATIAIGRTQPRRIRHD
jgi:drug/metabolite transporter (DMT)-like permease